MMPQVGLGTWQSAPGAVKAAVVAAIEAGYRHIDCAAGYGNEHEVGAALEDVIARGVVTRADLFITSKLWVANCFTDLAEKSLDKTLADLKTPYVDLYLVHWPYWIKRDSPFPAPMDARTGYDAAAFLAVWRVLEAAVDAGKVRALGTSNMSAKKLATLCAGARVPPAVNQVEAHPFLAQNQLQDWCTRHSIVCTAYSPLGSPDRPARCVRIAWRWRAGRRLRAASRARARVVVESARAPATRARVLPSREMRQRVRARGVCVAASARAQHSPWPSRTPLRPARAASRRRATPRRCTTSRCSPSPRRTPWSPRRCSSAGRCSAGGWPSPSP